MIAFVLLLVQADPAEALRQELIAASSATAVLQRRCAEPIRAVVDRAAAKPPTAEQRAELGVGDAEAVVYRSVSLNCGDKPLSIAENWYLPARLTPAMNQALAGDAPFGAVIRPLKPSRRTLAIATQGRDASVAPYALRQRALVLDAQGHPLAEVIENYTPAMLSLPALR